MGRFLFLLVGLVAVVLAVLAFAPGIIPVETYKDRIEVEASKSLGRDVSFSDDLSLRILPRTAFRVTDLTIANAEGFGETPLAQVSEADIGVNVLALLSGAVEVDRFVLIEPEINLVKKANGTVNWDLSGGDTPAPSSDENNGSGQNVPGLREFSLGDVRIVDGRASLRDDAAGKTWAVDDIDVNVILRSLSKPLEINGSFVHENQAASIDMVLTTLRLLQDEKPANLKYDFTIGDTTTSGDLQLTAGEALSYAGPIKFNAPNLAEFAKVAGAELADAPGFDKLFFSGNVDGNANALRLTDATINFDEINAQGAMTLNWSGPRVKAGGSLNADALDLRPYMPAPATTGGTASKEFPEWSNAPMDLTSLRNVDADFDITAQAIMFNGLKLDETRFKLQIANGRMTAEAPVLNMYNGQGSGRLVVNARNAVPSFAGSIDMSAVNAQPLSLDLFKQDNLLGLGTLKFDFLASGASQAAIMNSIDGSGGFELADGAIKGVNLAKIVRAAGELQSGFNPAALVNAVTAARGADEATDFSSFLSNWQITNGIVNTPTISLVNPYFNMNGSGTINLPNQTIDISLSPKASTGENGRTYTVPIAIGGTFSKPSVGVDAQALLRGSAGSKIRDLIGGRNKSEDGDSDEGSDGGDDTVRNVIEGLFGATPNNDGSESAPSGNTAPANDNTPESTSSSDSASDSTEGSASDSTEDVAKEAIKSIFGSFGSQSDEEAEAAEPSE